MKKPKISTSKKIKVGKARKMRIKEILIIITIILLGPLTSAIIT